MTESAAASTATPPSYPARRAWQAPSPAEIERSVASAFEQAAAQCAELAAMAVVIARHKASPADPGAIERALGAIEGLTDEEASRRLEAMKQSVDRRS